MVRDKTNKREFKGSLSLSSKDIMERRNSSDTTVIRNDILRGSVPKGKRRLKTGLVILVMLL